MASFLQGLCSKTYQGKVAEWDEAVLLAAAAYNFFPCQASKELLFVLMFGRDPITPFTKLLEPVPQYLGDQGGHLKMDLLKKLYLLTAENIKKARERQDPTEATEQKHDFKVNDLVFVRDVTTGTFAPRFTSNYRIIAIHGRNRIVVRNEKGNKAVRRASHLKTCDPKQKVTAMVPEHDEYKNFGRSMKLLLHTKDVPHLQFTSETDGN